MITKCRVSLFKSGSRVFVVGQHPQSSCSGLPWRSQLSTTGFWISTTILQWQVGRDEIRKGGRGVSVGDYVNSWIVHDTV